MHLRCRRAACRVLAKGPVGVCGVSRNAALIPVVKHARQWDGLRAAGLIERFGREPLHPIASQNAPDPQMFEQLFYICNYKGTCAPHPWAIVGNVGQLSHTQACRAPLAVRKGVGRTLPSKLSKVLISSEVSMDF